MKRFLILFLSFVFLVSVFAVPAFAATTADSQATSLQSGWLSSSAPSGYSSSWFWAVLSKLDIVSDYIIDIYSEISDVEYDVEAVSSKLTTVNSSISGLKTSVDNIKSYVDGLESSLTGIATDIGSIELDIGFIESDVETIRSEVVSIDATTSTISSNLSDVKSSISDIELNTDYLQSIDSDTSTLANLSSSLHSGSWLTSGGNGSWFRILYNLVNRIVEVNADADDLALNRSQSDEKQAVISGIANVNRVGDINQISGLEGDIKEFFAMDDVDVGLMFGQIEIGYSSWFSDYTARFLSVGGASAVSGAAAAVTYGLDRSLHEEPETPYLDASDAEVASILAGGNP